MLIPAVDQLGRVVGGKSDVVRLDVSVVGRVGRFVAVQIVNRRRYLQENVDSGLPGKQCRLCVVLELVSETAQGQQLVH